MQCGSIGKPSKLLKNILENDLDQIRTRLSNRWMVNCQLSFLDERQGRIRCLFTPLAAALLYAEESTLKVILEAGPSFYKRCEYRLSEFCRTEDEDAETIFRMEPAILLTRFLGHFRDDTRWHLLIPLCEAGFDPLQPSDVTSLDPEEEGGSMHHSVTTTVLDEIYLKFSTHSYDQILAHCDISKSFAKKDRIERFYHMIICPLHTSLDKFSCLVKHGFHDFSCLPTNVDVFVELVKEGARQLAYDRGSIYMDIFKRFQILMLVCDYKVTSLANYWSLGAFSDEDDMWIGGEMYVLNFFARLQDIILKWNSTPKRLAVLCRSRIRSHVRRPHFCHNVGKLGLPRYLVDFICLPSTRFWCEMGMRALDEDFSEGLPEFVL